MNNDQKVSPPGNCRQRLEAEGKPYPRSSCEACGQFSPKSRDCDALLSAHPAPQPPAGGEPEVLGWVIDWPDEPELGRYFSEENNPGARSRELIDRAHFTALQARLQAAEAHVTRLVERSHGQQSVATGYLQDILDVLKGEKL